MVPPVLPDRRAEPLVLFVALSASPVSASPADGPANRRPPVLTARALLLDMDGTLVNSDAVVERCWRRWATGTAWTREEALKVVHGRQGYATMAALLPGPPDGAEPRRERVMLAEETARHRRRRPGRGRPRLPGRARRASRTPW